MKALNELSLSTVLYTNCSIRWSGMQLSNAAQICSTALYSYLGSSSAGEFILFICRYPYNVKSFDRILRFAG